MCGKWLCVCVCVCVEIIRTPPLGPTPATHSSPTSQRPCTSSSSGGRRQWAGGLAPIVIETALNDERSGRPQAALDRAVQRIGPRLACTAVSPLALCCLVYYLDHVHHLLSILAVFLVLSELLCACGSATHEPRRLAGTAVFPLALCCLLYCHCILFIWLCLLVHRSSHVRAPAGRPPPARRRLAVLASRPRFLARRPVGLA